MTTATVQRELRRPANPEQALVSQWFFKTGPGEYAEGDRFIGVTVPQIRRLVRQCGDLSLTETKRLLRSPVHEERLLALLTLVNQFAKADDTGRHRIYEAYLQSTRYINNWDLVDCSAEHIVGAFLCSHAALSVCGKDSAKSRQRGDRAPRLQRMLAKLARSASLWERRIAVLATFHFIKRGEFGPTLRIARQLLRDREDLIHKAVGWMLREVGKRDLPAEEAFLRRQYWRMPRTMLRYAIERFPERKRQSYLQCRWVVLAELASLHRLPPGGVGNVRCVSGKAAIVARSHAASASVKY